MEQFSVAGLAAVVVDAFATAYGGAVGPQMRLDLLHRLETALRTATGAERAACAALCEARASLWASAEERPEAPAPLRSEARARYAEASYLTDAIRSR